VLVVDPAVAGTAERTLLPGIINILSMTSAGKGAAPILALVSTDLSIMLGVQLLSCYVQLPASKRKRDRETCGVLLPLRLFDLSYDGRSSAVHAPDTHHPTKPHTIPRVPQHAIRTDALINSASHELVLRGGGRRRADDCRRRIH
jgi:hypothetical protein